MKRVLLLTAAAILVLPRNFAAETLPADFNYYHANVQKVKQPDSMSCWAAALTMLYSFKQNMSLKIEDVLKPLGKEFVDIFKSGKGINEKQEEALYKKAGLKVIKGQNPTIEGWKNILKKGPLSVTVDADPPNSLIHALVVTGLKGDGTPAKTNIVYIDPADGKEREVPFMNFLKLYEGSANWPLQIIYW